jgi:hypothetical protein
MSNDLEKQQECQHKEVVRVVVHGGTDYWKCRDCGVQFEPIEIEEPEDSGDLWMME